MERRKLEERDFHNRLRDPALKEREDDHQYLTANKKYYSVATSSSEHYTNLLVTYGLGKRVLDYGCGDGQYSVLLARRGAQVVGIDISDISVRNCQARAEAEGLASATSFHVMDCEQLQFEDNSFDLVCESGVLHHLDLPRALAEVARVVKPGGRMVCYEALGHNLLFHAYRRLTPHLRTQYETEHILKLRDLDTARQFFERVEVKFFHLLVLGAVPFKGTRLFAPLSRMLEKVDQFVLRVPGIRRQAWIMVLVLSNPRKP
jgi:SAM-dependent methyltransferase